MNTATATRPSAATRTGGIVAVYVRISKDRTGAGLGVARQEKDCRRVIESLGLRGDVRVYVDNDLSAYSGKPRPAYDELLADVASGEVTALVAWHTDRLHRHPKELERFIDAIEVAGLAEIHTSVAGLLDLTTPSGRMIARQLGAVARYESELKSERAKLKHRELVDAGRPHGGCRRYGYTPGMAELVEHEAVVIRGMADALLAGRPLARVARELNAAGVLTSRGNTWTTASISKMLRREHLAGLRVHKGHVVRAAKWPSVLTESTHRALVELLSADGRRWTPNTAASSLLSSIAVCGVCGGKLRTARDGAAKRPSYVCREHACVSRAGAPVDLLVIEAVIARLSRSDAEWITTTPEAADGAELIQARIAVTEGRLADLGSLFVEGVVTRAQLDAGTRQGRADLAIMRAELAAVTEAEARPRILDGLTGSHAREVFEALDLGRQRAVVASLCTVTVNKAARQGAQFDPELVVIDWR